jgi:cysteinyl-tRNA synthetase
MSQLTVYNSLSRQKEVFEPLNPPLVGLYLCGPTVYGDPHLGHARPAICFDVLYRYLTHQGYKVRFVRNITDVGHLENDADTGEDKIAKKARLEQVEPMEIAQHYTDRYHHFIDQLNVRRPNIEPRATGHIPEQIELVKQILNNGFAYEVNGSVYFDVMAYSKHYKYGELSGRTNLDELLAGSRENLDGQDEKRHPADFALWKRAEPQHIMRWNSPWGEGFPGWHLECTAMSTKYLGEFFDIHGGGMDLKFPHHEDEIAQANACHHPHGPSNAAKYWMHNNLLTINGQKMGKSLGNFITLEELFAGNHTLLERAYSPMTVRFFTLQAHYRSTLDFSNEGLQAAEKGYRRLMKGVALARRLPANPDSTIDIAAWRQSLYDAMNDDLNTAITIAGLFEGVKYVHAVNDKEARLTAADRDLLAQTLEAFATEILGLAPEEISGRAQLDSVMQVLIGLRADARKEKNFALSDAIRDRLTTAGVVLRDGPQGTEWDLSN